MPNVGLNIHSYNIQSIFNLSIFGVGTICNDLSKALATSVFTAYTPKRLVKLQYKSPQSLINPIFIYPNCVVVPPSHIPLPGLL